MGCSGSRTMLQCATTLCAGRGAAPPGAGNPGSVGPAAPGTPVCVASTSTLSGKPIVRSTYDLVASIVPRNDWNSVIAVVNSRVASITAALSGPYDSTLNIAMMGP